MSKEFFSKSGKRSSSQRIVLLCLLIVATVLFAFTGVNKVNANTTAPVELLGDTNFANGFRAEWKYGTTYSVDNNRKIGDCTGYRDIGRTLSLIPNTPGDMNEAGKYWEFEEGVHKNYYDENNQYVSELFDHTFPVRYSNLQNTTNLLQFENTNYSGLVNKRFTSDKNGTATLYFNTKNEIRNVATDFGAQWATDTWPHYLMVQNFRQPIDLASYDQIKFTVDATLNSATQLPGWTLGPNQQISIPLYFLLSEKSSRIAPESQGGSLWVGVMMYSSEPINYAELLSTDQWGISMYHDDGANYGGRLAIGQTVKYDFDVKKMVAQAIKKAQAEGKYLKASPDDYVIRLMNIGYECLGYWESQVQFSNMSLKGYQTSNSVDEMAWDYTSGADGWSNGHNTSITTSGGVLTSTITGDDPWIYSPDNLNIDASQAKYVRVKLKNNTPGINSKLYWITNTDTTWDENKAIPITIDSNMAGYKEYVFDLSNQSSWNGMIKMLRIDPIDTGINSGSVDIDYVRVSNDPNAVNCKSWDFTTTGNLEGWGSPNQAALSVANGNLTASINGSDPYFFSPDNLSVDADVNKYIRIKLRNNCNDVYKCDFDTGNGWTNGHNTNLSVSGGILSAAITGNDPWIYSSDNLNLDATVVKYIRMKLNNTNPCNRMKVYFITNTDTTWDENKSIEFYVDKNMAGYEEYVADMYHNKSWTGTIKQVRVDLDDNTLTSGLVNFDYIYFSGDASAAVYWITDNDTTWDSIKAVGFKISPNETGYSEYLLDLRNIPSWSGKIKQIRIDPINDGSSISGTSDIDYVRVSR